MKRAILFAVLASGPLWAAGTCTQTAAVQIGQGSAPAWVVKVSCTGDGSSGSFPVVNLTALQPLLGGLISRVETVPGSTAPTGNYTETLLDAQGGDELGGQGSSKMSATATQIFSVNVGTAITAQETLNLSGNSVASAQVTIYIFAVTANSTSAAVLNVGAGGGSGGTPGGSAGGSLSGSYPNPAIASGVQLPGSPVIGTQPAQTDNSLKVASTNWVTQKLAALNPATAVQAATVTVLPNTPTYSNGTAGVGATLTAGSHAALVIDGYTVLLNDRVLINNQASAVQNGVYTETTLGSGSVSYVLTRAADFNTVAAINSAGAIPIINGTVNNNLIGVLNNAITTIGTSAITYSLVAAPEIAPINANVLGSNAQGALTSQTYSNVVSLWSTCFGTQYLGADGSCHTPPAGPTTNQNIRTLGASFGSFSSGATALSGTSIACVPTYFGGTITAVELIGTPSGSVTVDVKTVAHASFTGPSSTSSITASDIPALSSATTYTDTTLTGWTTTVSAGSDVCFYLTSPTTVTGVAIAVEVAAN